MPTHTTMERWLSAYGHQQDSSEELLRTLKLTSVVVQDHHKLTSVVVQDHQFLELVQGQMRGLERVQELALPTQASLWPTMATTVESWKSFLDRVEDYIHGGVHLYYDSKTTGTCNSLPSPT